MSRIGQFFVELGTRGLDVVMRSLAAVRNEIRNAPQSARWTFAGLNDMLHGSAQSAQAFSAALSPITGHLYGFFRQGLAASAAGQMMNLQMERLGHQIASLFIPQIRIVLDNLSKLVQWFRNLTGEQQETLRKTGLFLGAIMAAGIILPRIVATITALRAAFQALNAVAFGASLTNPWMLALVAIGLLLVALSDGETAMEKMANVAINLTKVFEGWADAIKSVGTLLSGLNISGGDKEKGWGHYIRNYAPVPAGGDLTAKWAERAGGGEKAQAGARIGGMILLPIGVAGTIARAFGLMDETQPDKEKKREELGGRVGGFESIDATYKRVAQASLQATAGAKTDSPEERSAKALEEILIRVKRLNTQADDHKPVVK